MQDEYLPNLIKYYIKYIGRLCFTSNDKGKWQMINLTHAICDLQLRVIQFGTRRCSQIQHGMQIRNGLVQVIAWGRVKLRFNFTRVFKVSQIVKL